ncbi:MAG TPA: hypothetical protein VFQ53_32360 [Kofleriaceae bacterium]|nr:hypothetical protein [Kofleriaceae bacterium]
MARPIITLLGLATLLAAHDAHAGRSHFAWLYGAEVNPERGVEVETWILEENKKGDAKTDETAFWWGPTLALTPQLQLAISMEAAYEDDRVGDAGVHFTRWGADVRYRLQSPDPVEAGPFAVLLRLGAKRLIEDRAGVRGEADVVASYQTGRLLATIDLGAIAERVPDANEVELRPAAGASVLVGDDVRLGAELYSELIVDGDATSWLVIGPTVSMTRGRFWGAATCGIGVFGIRTAPRVTFGLAL